MLPLAWFLRGDRNKTQSACYLDITDVFWWVTLNVNKTVHKKTQRGTFKLTVTCTVCCANSGLISHVSHLVIVQLCNKLIIFSISKLSLLFLFLSVRVNVFNHTHLNLMLFSFLQASNSRNLFTLLTGSLLNWDKFSRKDCNSTWKYNYKNAIL